MVERGLRYLGKSAGLLFALKRHALDRVAFGLVKLDHAGCFSLAARLSVNTLEAKDSRGWLKIIQKSERM